MKNKIILNFWYALLLLLGIHAVYVLFYVILGLVIKTFFTTGPIKIFLGYVHYLLFVPFIFWFAKKTDTNFKDSLFIPDLWTVIKTFVVVVLAQTIVFCPLDSFGLFFESLKNSELRVFGATLRPFSPLTDFVGLLIAPIIEEFFFRGLVLKNFLKKYSPVYAILLSSILFSIHHLSLDNSIFYIFAGILFGIIYYKTNSLIIVILAHMIWNAFSLLIYEHIQLDMASSIFHLFIYLSAFILLVFLLRKWFVHNKKQSSDYQQEISDDLDKI